MRLPQTAESKKLIFNLNWKKLIFNLNGEYFFWQFSPSSWFDWVPQAVTICVRRKQPSSWKCSQAENKATTGTQGAAPLSPQEMLQFYGKSICGQTQSYLAVMLVWSSPSSITLLMWCWNWNRISCYLWGLHDWCFATQKSINRFIDMPRVHFFFNPHLRGEKETSTGCLLHVPQPGIEPTTYVCDLTGDWTHKLLVYRTKSQPTEQPGLGCLEYSFHFWTQVQKSRLKILSSPQGEDYGHVITVNIRHK